jgi:hypothetical protein
MFPMFLCGSKIESAKVELIGCFKIILTYFFLILSPCLPAQGVGKFALKSRKNQKLFILHYSLLCISTKSIRLFYESYTSHLESGV